MEVTEAVAIDHGLKKEEFSKISDTDQDIVLKYLAGTGCELILN